MMEDKPKDPPVQVETVVKDFVRFLPEEKRDDYELMLRRCNFHDSDDPLFPIMLFLLFFQESVSENVNGIEDSISEIKTVLFPRRKGKTGRTVRIFNILLTALTIVNLVLFCCGIFRNTPPLTEKTVKTAAQTSQSELQKINRYWTRKLEEKPEIRQTGFCDERIFTIIAAAGAVCAWIPAVFLLLQWKRRPLGEKQNEQAARIYNQFRRQGRHKKRPRPKE